MAKYLLYGQNSLEYPHQTIFKKEAILRKSKLISSLVCILLVSLILTSCSFNSPKATITPTASPEPSPTILPTSTLEPTLEPTATVLPTTTPTPLPQYPFDYVVVSGDTLGSISERFSVPIAFIVIENGLTDPDYIVDGQILRIPDPSATPSVISKTDKEILVVLSLQKVYVYENGILIKDFTVSTGVADSPTVQGTYTIIEKLSSTRMSGPGYDYKKVPWVMYFYKGYSFHGAYWHNNFGQPMSHGCVNMKIEDADWLYHWAQIGTIVLVVP